MNIKVGLIGCGGISRTHVSALRTLGYPTLAAVCDIRHERALERGAEVGLPKEKCYKDYADMLMDPEIEAVIIGTPHYHHAIAAVDALNAGKHVLSEKPMATALEDADKMIAAAAKSGTTFGVVFQHRFDPSAAKVRKAIGSGYMGKPMVAIASVPWYRDQGYYDVDPWKGTWAQEGGSSLINQAIHTLDRMIWFMGRPVSVMAETAVLNHGIETEDVTSLSVTFEGGAIGTLTATTCAWPSQPERVEIYCREGSACISGTTLTRFETMASIPEDFFSEISDEEKTTAFVPGKACYGTSHVEQFHDFFSAIALKREPLVTGAEARKTLAVVVAAYESAKTGKRVSVNA